MYLLIISELYSVQEKIMFEARNPFFNISCVIKVLYSKLLGESKEKWEMAGNPPTSISNPFCSSCSRLRLSADGKLYTCLFSFSGKDLKLKLRQCMNDLEIKNWIKNIWQTRNDQYSQIRSIKKNSKYKKKIEMYQIGG